MKSVTFITSVLVLAGSVLAQSVVSVRSEKAELRSSPAGDSIVVADVATGELVELIREEFGSDWLYVSYKGMRGWMRRDQVGDGAAAQQQLAELASEQNRVIEEHIAKELVDLERRTRTRGKPQEKMEERRSVTGDLDGDGDRDLALSYVLVTGTGVRSEHRVAVFANEGNAYALVVDERADRLGMREGKISDIRGGNLGIESGGAVGYFALKGSALTRATPNIGDPAAPDDDPYEYSAEQVPVEGAGQASSADDDNGADNKTLKARPKGGQAAGAAALEVAGQDESDLGVTRVRKDVVNGSAIELPAPDYPAAAIAVNASGAVRVAVVIGTDGNVISANAVSGHPLLRSAAAEAAMRARFRPTFIDGVPVEVSGVIVYNFQPPSPGGGVSE